MDQTRWNTHPSRATTRQNFCSALAGRHVLERRNPAVGESDHLPRIRNTWRDIRIVERIVERIAEESPRAPRLVRWIICCVVNIKPGLRRAAAHVAYDFSVRRTP